MSAIPPKGLPLTESARERVEDALSEVNGRATANTIATLDEVRRVAEHADERLLELGIPGLARSGCEIVYAEGGSPCYSYKYTMTRTEITLRQLGAAWRLIGARRVAMHPKDVDVDMLGLTPEARTLAIKHALRGTRPLRVETRDSAESEEVQS